MLYYTKNIVAQVSIMTSVIIYSRCLVRYHFNLSYEFRASAFVSLQRYTMRLFICYLFSVRINKYYASILYHCNARKSSISMSEGLVSNM